MEQHVNTQSFWIHPKISFEETDPEVPLYWYVHSKDRISQMPLALWIQQHEGMKAKYFFVDCKHFYYDENNNALNAGLCTVWHVDHADFRIYF